MPKLLIQEFRLFIFLSVKSSTVILEMEIVSINTGSLSIAELRSDEVIINNVEDGTNLLGEIYYGGFDAVVLHKKNITPLFFDLSTRIAGEILQKFSTYRLRLAIVGDFSEPESSSLRDFIRESNKAGHVIFVDSTEKAIEHFGV